MLVLCLHHTGMCIADILVTIIKITGTSHETVCKDATGYAHYRNRGLGYRNSSGLPFDNNDCLTTMQEQESGFTKF